MTLQEIEARRRSLRTEIQQSRQRLQAGWQTLNHPQQARATGILGSLGSLRRAVTYAGIAAQGFLLLRRATRILRRVRR